MGAEHELHGLVTLLRLRRIDRASYRRALGALLRQHLRCDAVSLWRLDGVASRHRLRLVGRHASPGGLPWPPCGGESWQEHEAPALLQKLLCEGGYRCADTRLDPALDGLQAPWLQAQGVRALMLVPLRLNGRVRSVICCEQQSPRIWTRAELARLKRFASAAGLLLGQLDRLERMCADTALWPALA